jgi:hypothetical protein
MLEGARRSIADTCALALAQAASPVRTGAACAGVAHSISAAKGAADPIIHGAAFSLFMLRFLADPAVTAMDREPTIGRARRVGTSSCARK